MKQTLILSAAVLALGLTSASAQTAMRCSHQLPPTHAIAGVIDRWAERVEELSDGEIDVQVFGAASLVGPNENIVAVARGEIECAFSVNFQWGRTLPIMNVTIAPYAFSDMTIWRNWHDSEAAAFLNERMAQRGLVNVAWLFQTNSSVFTSRGRLMVTPEDFEGMKIRGLTPAFDAALAALGAVPSAMPGSEVYQGLATGVIDGAITDVAAAVARRFYEVQDHFSIVPVISVYINGYVNPRFHAGLSDAGRAALDQAGREAAGWAIEAAEAGIAAAPDQLRARGATVHEMTAEENAALEALMRPAFDAALSAEADEAAQLLELIEQLRSGS
ncbi:MAG: TRAP transporter substrate-binding protein DctP [Pararhodobacter sp.]|nr:TRAP transporter substrate-binding protein DctP [Pararhodobacter sp.]